jgi:hypothetical protein
MWTLKRIESEWNLNWQHFCNISDARRILLVFANVQSACKNQLMHISNVALKMKMFTQDFV